MKNTKQLLALIAATVLAASAWAQSADDDYKSLNAQITDKNAKPTEDAFQKTSKAVVDFLAAYPGDKRATGLVNDALAYGAKMQSNKTPTLAQAWYSHMQNCILDKQIEPDLTPKAKDALAALMAAMAEGEMKLVANAANLSTWRDKLNTLLDAPSGTPFVLDRERNFYNYIANMPSYKKAANDQLAKLSQHKDKNISGWAKQEMLYNEIRKTPFTLSVTTINGKKFDTSAFKGSPYLYLYFWSIGSKNADADLKKLADVYDSYTRRQLEVLVVCCDAEEKRADVTALLKKNKLPLPVYFDGKGKDGDLYGKFGISRIPMGFIFDIKGYMGAPGFSYDNIKKLGGK